MAYRDRPRGGHIEGLDELEAQLRRGVRRRRLVMGFLALVTGIGFITVGVLMTLRTFGPFHGRGEARLPILMAIFGVGLCALAFIILRVGEIKDSDGMEIHEVDPIPWSTLGLVSAGILVVTGLVAAYPLGFYRWADTLRSPCRNVFTPHDADAISVASFTVGNVTNDDLRCSMSGVGGTMNQRTVSVVLAADKGGSQFKNELAYLGGDRTSLSGMGDEAYLLEKDYEGERIIIVRRRHAAMVVHLSSRIYDRAAALRVAKHLEGKVSLLEPYADRWKAKYGHD